MPSIYLAECPERRMLKIGRTKYLPRRVRDLFRTVPGEWRIVDSFAGWGVERSLHERLSAFRLHGREWYRDCPEVRAAFCAAKRELVRRLRAEVVAAQHKLNEARAELRSAKEALREAKATMELAQ